MKTYNVIWEERMSVNVQANSKEEAEQKVHDCEYQDDQVSSELSLYPEAYEVEVK